MKFRTPGKGMFLNIQYYYHATIHGACRAYWDGKTIHVNQNYLDFIAYYGVDDMILYELGEESAHKGVVVKRVK